jgi:TolB protein
MQLFYTVRPGDTLNAIAHRWSIPLRSLMEANQYTRSDAPGIVPGQQLSMPPGVSSTVVKPGDSVYTIAKQYGIRPAVIMEANNMIPPYTVTAGATILVPTGVPYYVVVPGDTLNTIAQKYGVTRDGKPWPEKILESNPGVTSTIQPGLRLIIPDVPVKGAGWLATVFTAVFFNGQEDYIGLYRPLSGDVRSLPVPEAGRLSTLYWSSNQTKIAYSSNTGGVYLVQPVTGQVLEIDHVSPSVFIDWSYRTNRLVYSTRDFMRIYTVSDNTYQTIERTGTTYVQWFPNDRELLYEAADADGNSQLYRCRSDGSDIRQITGNPGGPYHAVRLSRDGRMVCYTSPGVSTSVIDSMDLSTGT